MSALFDLLPPCNAIHTPFGPSTLPLSFIPISLIQVDSAYQLGSRGGWACYVLGMICTGMWKRQSVLRGLALNEAIDPCNKTEARKKESEAEMGRSLQEKGWPWEWNSQQFSLIAENGDAVRPHFLPNNTHRALFPLWSHLFWKLWQHRMLPERQNHDGGGKEAWPEETSQETACVDNSDFGSLRKRRESTWSLPSNPGRLRRVTALCTSTDQGTSWQLQLNSVQEREELSEKTVSWYWKMWDSQYQECP